MIVYLYVVLTMKDLLFVSKGLNVFSNSVEDSGESFRVLDFRRRGNLPWVIILWNAKLSVSVATKDSAVDQWIDYWSAGVAVARSAIRCRRFSILGRRRYCCLEGPDKRSQTTSTPLDAEGEEVLSEEVKDSEIVKYTSASYDRLSTGIWVVGCATPMISMFFKPTSVATFDVATFLAIGVCFVCGLVLHLQDVNFWKRSLASERSGIDTRLSGHCFGGLGYL